MNINIVSFTYQGSQLGKKIEQLCKDKHQIAIYTTNESAQLEGCKGLNGSLKRWTQNAFSTCEGIIFIGACAIAVRSIAPLLQGKTKDPAILVVDELGKHVISLLSGHIGGGNELTLEVAGVIGAEPIITTATDLHKKLAIDVFAKKNNLHIWDMKQVKEIAVAILEEKSIGFLSEGMVYGEIPKELAFLEPLDSKKTLAAPSKNPDYMVSVGIIGPKQQSNTCYLIPKVITLGIGCKKGRSLEDIESCVLEVLAENSISMDCIVQIVSIDLKKEEEGLLGFCEKYQLPFRTYSSEILGMVEGKFTPSDYVKRITGVDNVCERAAVCGSGQGTLFINKIGKNGVTVAAAFPEWSVNFE